MISNLVIKSYFFSHCPFRICTFNLKTCNKDILKTIIASSFKHGQLIKKWVDYLMDKQMTGDTVFHKFHFNFFKYEKFIFLISIF